MKRAELKLKTEPGEAANLVHIPDWVEDTPNEDAYGLCMWEGGGGCVEEVKITRAEYIALKLQLAARRGYTISGAAERVDALASELQIGKYEKRSGRGQESAHEDIGMYVGVARELYRRCPEAIASDAGLEAVLKGVVSAASHPSRIQPERRPSMWPPEPFAHDFR